MLHTINGDDEELWSTPGCLLPIAHEHTTWVTEPLMRKICYSYMVLTFIYYVGWITTNEVWYTSVVWIRLHINTVTMSCGCIVFGVDRHSIYLNVLQYVPECIPPLRYSADWLAVSREIKQYSSGRLSSEWSVIL